MSAISALAKNVGDCMAAVNKLVAAEAAEDSEGDVADGEALKTIKADQEKLAAELKTQGEQLKASQAAVAQMKKEKALLGFTGSEADRAKLAAAPVEDIEKLTADQKDYLTLVAEHATAAKCKKSDAHLHIQRTHREAYAAHLRGKGVYDPSRATTKAA